ncbi:MAG: hypothetical protein IKJ97_04560 [Bacteroidaceae bacterium]|nr:hypothetical protein [Bacteroidaceae bacterium]
MKKIFLGLVLLLVSTGAIFAQSSILATLSHEGEISVFYGADALKEAHAAATHGDAITLSSGSFNAANITKAITLRGAGMAIDTLKNTYPTVINGSFNIEIGDSVSKQLTVEGIYNNHTITVKKGLNNATFIKNRLSTILYEAVVNDTAQYQNNRFIHCKIATRFFGPLYSSNESFSFINSYIRSIYKQSSNSIFTNCIIHNNASSFYNHNGVKYYSSLSSLTNCTFYNCIFIGTTNEGSNYNTFKVGNLVYNCIATGLYADNIKTSSAYYTFNNINNSTNHCIQSMSSVFKSFTGKYMDNETFELVEDIKTKYTGTDGTEIGIHGGSLPFFPTPTNPQITKCNVASRSTADGKLSVDIEVKAGE